jgi:hypothetical protein
MNVVVPVTALYFGPLALALYRRWGGQFDERDLVALQRHRDRGTADPIPLIAVSRSGASTTRVDAAFTPGQPDRSLVNRRCSASVRRSRPGGFTSSGKQSAPMRTPTVA